jgi:microcin C transport system substrate-binding protein
MRGTRSQPRPGLDRRAVVAGAGALGVAAVLTAAGSRAADVESHGLSTFGDLQLPPDFRHLPYVSPNAPKGGTLSLQIKQTVGNQNFDTFNTLHIYVLKGDGAAGMPGTFDTLMAGSGDEPDAGFTHELGCDDLEPVAVVPGGFFAPAA